MKQQYREFLVRDWQPGDRQPVSSLVQTVLAEYGMSFEPDSSDRDAVQIEDAYWNTGGEFWVADYQGTVIGSGGYYPSHRAANAVELRKMFILPEFRRQGLGRFLLSELEQSAATKGFTEMWLETATVLKEAIGLYERYGYQPSTGVETQRCDRIYYKFLSQPNDSLKSN
ncbi:MAG: GNAT family N-acetyltransferase [Cyanobacteria bacterium P01_E01_bin.6]